MIVVKFGGSILGEYKDADKNLKILLNTTLDVIKNNDDKIIVILSAFKNITRKLLSITVNLNFSKKQSDEILSYGEVFTCNIVEKFLSNNLPKNLSCASFHEHFQPEQFSQESHSKQNSQIILTNDDFSQANVISINTNAIQNALKNHNIVIIPGFIGKNFKYEVTTLGFEGSDITAISIAQNMKATQCILFKDVGGCYSANPKHTPNAILYHQLDYDQATIMAKNSNILHEKCIEMARSTNLLIKIQSTSNEVLSSDKMQKTIIGNETNEKFFYLTSNLDKISKNIVNQEFIEIKLFVIKDLIDSIDIAKINKSLQEYEENNNCSIEFSDEKQQYNQNICFFRWKVNKILDDDKKDYKADDKKDFIKNTEKNIIQIIHEYINI